ncbi:MAG: hypothetical protein CSB34_04885 [Desulfobulbus propionicus]|nr:MAG: hypothetical protein CSB34_04885 [Desulfobulbus propionicus]
MKKCLVSACLTGLATRYDGKTKLSPPCMAHVRNHFFIPVCPEQLGGLATPRTAADIIGGNGFDVLKGKAVVVDRNGEDVTAQFIKGAEMTLTIARFHDITTCYFKARSPSCALNGVTGVAAALLLNNGITIIEFE